MVEENDWRLTGQKEYLTGITLYRKSWKKTRPDWDHDHCEFCFAKFMDQDLPNILRDGYTDEQEYRWICDTCFNDFKEHFSWKLGNKAN